MILMGKCENESPRCVCLVQVDSQTGRFLAVWCLSLPRGLNGHPLAKPLATPLSGYTRNGKAKCALFIGEPCVLVFILKPGSSLCWLQPARANMSAHWIIHRPTFAFAFVTAQPGRLIWLSEGFSITNLFHQLLPPPPSLTSRFPLSTSLGGQRMDAKCETMYMSVNFWQTFWLQNWKTCEKTRTRWFSCLPKMAPFE